MNTYTADHLRQAAHRLRSLYDGRGSHLAVAYSLEAEAKEIEMGLRAHASPLSAALAQPYLTTPDHPDYRAEWRP